MYQVTHRNGERFSAAKAYLTPHLGRPNLHVITGAHATRVLIEGGVRSVWMYRQGARNRCAPSARCCCAPARCSRRSCCAVGHRPGRAPAPARHRGGARPARRGQQLHDHPDVVQVWDAPGTLRDCSACRWPAPGARRARLGAMAARAHRHADHQLCRGGRLPQEPSGPVRRSAIALRHRQAGQPRPQNGVWPRLFVPCVPAAACKSRGSVRLASADPLQAPAIDPALLADPEDMARMVRGFARCASCSATRRWRSYRRAANCRPARAQRRTDRAVHPQLRRHHLPPGGQLPHGQRRAGRGGRPAARARPGRGCAWWTPRSCRAWWGQHQRAGGHDCREGGGHDPRRPDAVTQFTGRAEIKVSLANA
jgi:hypothetical protein